MAYQFTYEECLKYEGLKRFIDEILENNFKVKKSSLLAKGLWQIQLCRNIMGEGVEYFIDLDYINYNWSFVVFYESDGLE